VSRAEEEEEERGRAGGDESEKEARVLRGGAWFPGLVGRLTGSRSWHLRPRGARG
jgi:hypothetical protein